MKQKDFETTELISEISFGGEVSIKAKKMYFIHDDSLIGKIDAIVSQHYNGNIQTLDGGEETEGGNQ